MKKHMSTSRLRKAQGRERPHAIPGRSVPLKHAKIMRQMYGAKLDRLLGKETNKKV
jgi:hypothetical protein